MPRLKSTIKPEMAVQMNLEAHERECAVRWENLERRLEDGSTKFKKLEALLWGVYPFIVAAVIAGKFI